MVMSEKLQDRRDLVKYFESRHPYLSDPSDRPKFLSGALTNAFEVNDSSLQFTRHINES